MSFWSPTIKWESPPLMQHILHTAENSGILLLLCNAFAHPREFWSELFFFSFSRSEGETETPCSFQVLQHAHFTETWEISKSSRRDFFSFFSVSQCSMKGEWPLRLWDDVRGWPGNADCQNMTSALCNQWLTLLSLLHWLGEREECTHRPFLH